MTSLKEALVRKYGTPDMVRSDGDGTMHLVWLHDPQGKAIARNSPLAERCDSSIATMDSSINVNPDCGISVFAQLRALRGTPALVDFMVVRVVDSAGGYHSVVQTEKQLQQQDQQRQQQAVEAASKDVKAPAL